MINDDFLDDEDENFTPKKRVDIEIPDFLNKGVELPTEEQIIAQATLNNIPNNTDIEKQNHLAELDRACQNWDEEEWRIVIQRANSSSMCEELKRRMEVLEVYVSNQRNNMNVLTVQKL